MMGVLEAARRLAAADVRSNGTTWCHFCDALIEDPESYSPPMPLEEQHSDDCPWLAMPSIVKALEAAADVVADYKPQGNWAAVMLRLEAALEGR